MRVTLHPHPADRPVPSFAVTVELERRADELWVRFVVEGDRGTIEWPASAAPGRADDLWRHTCFEVFIRTGHGYREINLSPSGRWASYAFDGYREAMRQADATVEIDGMDAGRDHAAMEARLPLHASEDRLALAAVIEQTDGTKSYWALTHPSDKPDFHHPGSFILDVP